MVDRSIKVRVIKETTNTVTLFFPSLNRKMPVPKEDFESRVKNGTYEVLGTPTVSTEE